MTDGTILEGGTQPIIENPQDGQTQVTTVGIEEHKNLQSDYTRSRQDAIDLATQLVEANPKALSTIKDSRIQNAVAKQVYGFDTYNQLIAVLGENFHLNQEEENLDKTAQLEREVRILKFKSESNELESAIKSFRLLNSSIVVTDNDEEKLRKELQFISKELPVSERISRASRIAFGSMPNPNSVYKEIAVGTPMNGGNGVITQPSAKDAERQKQIEAGRKLLNLI